MPREWTVKQIRDLVEARFGKRPCWYQIKVALALHAGKDVVGCAATGAGKTLSFWISLLMALEDGEDKMVFVVTPLNLLGKQNVTALEKAGLPAVAVSSENASPALWKDIEDGRYRVVIINPELLMGSEDVTKLWTKPKVKKRIQYFAFDEGHCISQWGKFRKEYLLVGDLRYLISEDIPFYVASATLPPTVLLDVSEILRLRAKKTEHIIRSNDRPEMRLMVRSLVFPAKSFKDLSFLIPEGYKDGDPPISKFLVFFDNTKETESACQFLRSLLPPSNRNRIKYFHSTMTQAYRDDELEAMRGTETWGLCCTDAFGMGMDLPDIEIVVQWKATCDLCALWQRFGRVARGPGKEGTAILLVEKKDTNEERAAKAERVAKRKEKTKEGIGTSKKRKAGEQGGRKKETSGVLTDRNVNINHAAVAEVEVDPAKAAEITLLEERRAHYAYREKTGSGRLEAPKGKARQDIEVGSAMDDFINTPEGVKCRRVVLRLFFQNDRTPTDDHLRCDPNSTSGCTRCAPRTYGICCDRCHSSFFKQFHVPTAISSSTSVPGKSKVKAGDMTTKDHHLKMAILEWRRVHAIEKFGPTAVQQLGSKLLISDQIVDRLVLCARIHKLPTVASIFKETAWRKDWAGNVAPSLLALIHSHYPLPLPEPPQHAESSTSLTSTTTAASESTPLQSTKKSRAKQNCSRCKALGLESSGHNKSNRSCPGLALESAQTHNDNENVPPSAPANPTTPVSNPRYYRNSLTPSVALALYAREPLTPNPITGPLNYHPLHTPSHAASPYYRSR